MSKQRGFTLIELMIVVVVIAVLAAIAVPNFLEQSRKGRRAEAVRAMGEYQLAMERWRAECSTFADATACKDSDGDGAVETGEGVYPSTPTADNYTMLPGSATATGYSITATRAGKMLNDSKCGDFTLTVSNGAITKSMSSGDVAYCWGQ